MMTSFGDGDKAATTVMASGQIQQTPANTTDLGMSKHSNYTFYNEFGPKGVDQSPDPEKNQTLRTVVSC